MSSETDVDDPATADGGSSDGDAHSSGDADSSDGDATSSSDGDADGSTDGGYVHTPEGTDGAGGPPGDDRVASGGEPEPDGFGRKGWVLTAVLFTCVLVIPGIIYVYPYAAGAFGFTFFATYLALPLVPAVLLGLVAVWSMTAATPDE